MKKNILRFSIVLMLTGISMALPAQAPPLPPSGHGNTETQTPTGGTSAPLGSGSLLLISLGAAYLARKGYTTFATKPDTGQ